MQHLKENLLFCSHSELFTVYCFQRGTTSENREDQETLSVDLPKGDNVYSFPINRATTWALLHSGNWSMWWLECYDLGHGIIQVQVLMAVCWQLILHICLETIRIDRSFSKITGIRIIISITTCFRIILINLNVYIIYMCIIIMCNIELINKICLY